jgi:hypothetical protein
MPRIILQVTDLFYKEIGLAASVELGLEQGSWSSYVRACCDSEGRGEKACTEAKWAWCGGGAVLARRRRKTLVLTPTIEYL